MKKLLLVFLLCLPITVTFAVPGDTYYLVFDKNPVSENVVSFIVNCNDNLTVYSTSNLATANTQWRTPNNFCGILDGDYHVTVIATNSAGNSPPSNGVDFFISGGIAYHPPITVPGAPTNLGIVIL